MTRSQKARVKRQKKAKETSFDLYLLPFALPSPSGQDWPKFPLEPDVPRSLPYELPLPVVPLHVLPVLGLPVPGVLEVLPVVPPA